MPDSVQIPLFPPRPAVCEILLHGKYGGMTTLVDEDDYAYLSQWTWYRVRSTGRETQGYARRCERNATLGVCRHIFMHNAIMHPPLGMVVDHIGITNTLDNRRANLRIVDASTQRRNRRLQRNNMSGYRGVYFHKVAGRWRAELKDHGVCILCSLHDTAEEAAAAYEDACRRHGLLIVTRRGE